MSSMASVPCFELLRWNGSATDKLTVTEWQTMADSVQEVIRGIKGGI